MIDDTTSSTKKTYVKKEEEEANQHSKPLDLFSRRFANTIN